MMRTNTRLKKIDESGLSRIYQHYMEHDSGTISAFRGNLELKENKARNKELKGYLLSKGYGVTSIKGTYIENYGKEDAREVNEESFFVIDLEDSGNLKQDLIKMGKKYGQDSITFSKSGNEGGLYYLIGTNEDGFPGFGKEVKLGKPMFGKDGQFHSKINGRPFVFESYKDVSSYHDFDDSIKNYSLFSKRYIKETFRWE